MNSSNKSSLYLPIFSLLVAITSLFYVLSVSSYVFAQQPVQPANIANTTPWLHAPTAEATTANSALTSYLTSAASTNSTSVKGSAGNLYGISIINTTSTLYYLRMYNSSSAPTCSSATGFIESIPAPHNTGNGGGISRSWATPQGYTTGIGFCLTGGGSSTDNTNAATGVYITVLYK